MQFTLDPAYKDEDDSVIKTWKSENGLWLVQVYRVMFGTRIRARMSRDYYYYVDYCAGADQIWIEACAVAILKFLEQYPETVHGRDVEEALPRYNVRPMARDPRCWRQLTELAQVPYEYDETAEKIDEYDYAPDRDYFGNSVVDLLLKRLSPEPHVEATEPLPAADPVNECRVAPKGRRARHR